MSDVRRVIRGVVLPRCMGTRTLMMGSAVDAVDCGACDLGNEASKDMRGSPIRASSCISTSWHRARSVMLLKGPRPPGQSVGAKFCPRKVQECEHGWVSKQHPALMGTKKGRGCPTAGTGYAMPEMSITMVHADPRRGKYRIAKCSRGHTSSSVLPPRRRCAS
jgi:hypothetical protein